MSETTDEGCAPLNSSPNYGCVYEPFPDTWIGDPPYLPSPPFAPVPPPIWEVPPWQQPVPTTWTTTTSSTFLTDAAREATESAQVCRVTRCKEFMTPEQIADLELALRTPKITAAAIARTLYAQFGPQLKEKYGIEDIKPKTAQRHRRGECSCARTS